MKLPVTLLLSLCHESLSKASADIIAAAEAKSINQKQCHSIRDNIQRALCTIYRIESELKGEKDPNK